MPPRFPSAPRIRPGREAATPAAAFTPAVNRDRRLFQAAAAIPDINDPREEIAERTRPGRLRAKLTAAFTPVLNAELTEDQAFLTRLTRADRAEAIAAGRDLNDVIALITVPATKAVNWIRAVSIRTNPPTTAATMATKSAKPLTIVGSSGMIA